MKRLLALLLAMGVLVAAAPDLVRAQDEKKEEKKKDDKKEGKKDEKKAEEKLTDAQKDELKKLAGTFKVTAFERDGEKYTEDKLKKMKVTQKDAGDYTFQDGDDITLGKDTVYPDKDPKECDSLYLNNTAKGEVVKGIYKVDNDTITYCWADPKKDRPKEFATKKDSGLTLMTLKRVEEKKEEKKKDEKKEEGKKEEKKEEKKDDK